VGDACSANTTGFDNTARGYGALSGNGIGNTTNGRGALVRNRTGSYNRDWKDRA
jgi:hypothetical protein